MDTKLKGFIIIVVIVVRLSGAVAVGQAQENADSLIVGPYTEIQFPPQCPPSSGIVPN